MAQDAELGAATGYLKQPSLHLHGWRNRSDRDKPRHDKRCHHDQRSQPVPGLWCVLFVFQQLAAFHHRGRCRSRSDPGKICQRPRIGNALRRRPLQRADRKGWRGNGLRDLCCQAGRVPNLHARRSRMRHGATPARAANFGSRRVVDVSSRRDGVSELLVIQLVVEIIIHRRQRRERLGRQRDGLAVVIGRHRRTRHGRVV
jgi:hypothetical protein